MTYRSLRAASACVSVALLFLLAFGRAQTFAQEKAAPSPQIAPASELAKAPAKEQARRNPLEHDPNAVAAGGKLFARHCAECHGSHAEGTPEQGPSLLVGHVQQAPAGALFWLVTNGVVRRGMPVWSKLPEAQRWQIITYLKSLGATSAP